MLKRPIHRLFEFLDFSKIGLGDCLMAIAVVHYLLKQNFDILANPCVIAVPTPLTGIAKQLLSSFNVRILGAGEDFPKKIRGKTLIPRAPASPTELLQHFSGRSVFVNWADNYARSGFPYGKKEDGELRKLRFLFFELTQFKTIDWKTVAPVYLGFRILFPLLAPIGYPLIRHVVAIKETLPDLRNAMRRYYESLPPSDFPKGGVVIFPAAASFNAIPAHLCSQIERTSSHKIHFAVHKDDPWLESYRQHINELLVFSSTDALLKLINENIPVFVDGFASHLGQLVKDEMLILYTRDSKERLIHPGAQPRVLQFHPQCAPCTYKLRATIPLCPAGFSYCTAFDVVKNRINLEIDHCMRIFAIQSAAH